MMYVYMETAKKFGNFGDLGVVQVDFVFSLQFAPKYSEKWTKKLFHPETIFSSCYARAGKEGKRLINFRLRPLFYLNLKQKPLFLFLPRGRLEPATSGKLIRALYQLSHR